MNYVWISLGALLVIGIYLFKRSVDRAPDPTPNEIANTIEDFLNGTGGMWDWDDFISVPLKDPKLDAIRRECVYVEYDFPPQDKGQWCSEAGCKALRDIARRIRETSQPPPAPRTRSPERRSEP